MIDRLLKIITDNNLDQDPRVTALLCAIARNPNDKAKIQTLYRLINPVLVHNKFFGTPYSKPDYSVDGPIRFAVAENGIPVGIYPEEGHILIVGQTRSGKTTTLFLKMAQVIKSSLGKVILFVKTHEARALSKLKDTIIINPNTQICINPFEVPHGMSKLEYNSIWADTFVQAFSIYDGTKNFLLEHLNNIESLTLSNLYRKIKFTKYLMMSRFARYQESALNRLGGFINSPLGNIFNIEKGFKVSLTKLFNYNVIFEIQNFIAEQQVFFVNLITQWIFFWKLLNSINQRHFIGLDDANLLLDISFEHRPDKGQPIISHLLSTVAKSKTYLYSCSQIPSKIGTFAHSNTFCKIMFSLADGRDISCMARSMGLDREQEQYCHNLKIENYEFIMKLSRRYTKPFFARALPFQITEEPDNLEILLNNERILRTFPQEPEEAVIIETTEENKEEKDKEISEERQKEQESTLIVTPDEKILLVNIYSDPFKPTTQRYKDLKLSAGKGSRIVKSLLNKKLCRIININIGGRGGSIKLLELEDEAYKAIDMPKKKHLTRGGSTEHDFWVKKIADSLKDKGYEPEIEKRIKDKFIDIVIQKNILIAIEIAITSTNEKANIEKDIQSGIDFIIIATKDAKVLRDVHEILNGFNQTIKDKIGICLLQKLLKCNKLSEITNSECLVKLGF